MTPTIRRLLTLAAAVAVVLAGTSAGLAFAATRTIATPLRTPPTVRRLTALPQQGQVAVATRALPGAELPRDWQDHGTWWPAIGQRGAQTTQIALFLGPTAGWLPCQDGPTGVSVAGRPMTYRCAAIPGSAAGAITLVAPLVHTATGWWEQAATDSTKDADTYQAFRVATLTRASNGRPWYVTTRRQRVRIEAPPPPVPTLGLRPGSQRVPAGHPAGVTVTGSGWPTGAYAVLWDLTDNVNTTPKASDWCTAPNCQWMLTAPSPPGTYQFTVYLHAASGARIATSGSVQVTWASPTTTPTATPVATPTPTPTATPVATSTPTPTPTSTIPIYSYPNWSGYTVGNGPYTGASGNFNVPSIYASSTVTNTSEWVGIDGVTNNDVLQTGVDEIYDPSTNLVTFQPWYETYPAPPVNINMYVSPGDQMTATVAYMGNGEATMTLTDDTTGATFSTEQPYSGPLTSAEWIAESPGYGTSLASPLGDYTPDVTFTNLGLTGPGTSWEEDIMVQNGVQVSTPSA
ncbi:MAG TPA: G1 family glutamic endopeptidase, partial [Candidatus Micrarchaeia archaeon]|nr:G1 family glutamic endopeptidase [Candidatus Micrarchaeia archaeon]